MISDALSSTIEVVMPVRNPTAVLRQSVGSLAAQTTRDFSVCLSDNWSSKGQEYFAEAERELRAAGVAVRLVRPPVELGRIEHWNWSHHQSEGGWIKPLFAGDWLAEGYMETAGAALAAHPSVDIVNCSMAQHPQEGPQLVTVYAGGVRSPERVLADAFRAGNCFGGPVNVCLRKLAFLAVGGYPPALPVAADFWVILMLALRNGLVTCPEVLAHFNFHPDRFTTNFPWHRIDGNREQWTILLAASSQADFMEIPADFSLRNRYLWQLGKQSIKARLRRAFSHSAPP